MKRSQLERRTPLRAKAPMRSRFKSVEHVDPKLAALGVRTLVDFPSEGKLIADAIKRRKTKHARRDRAPDSWFLFVRTQPCFVRWLVGISLDFDLCVRMIPSLQNLTMCRGPVEADHMGSKMRDGGDGEMAADRTCVSMCHGHHMERHDFSDTFKDFKQEDMRRFLSGGIEWMHGRARDYGIVIPNC